MLYNPMFGRKITKYCFKMYLNWCINLFWITSIQIGYAFISLMKRKASRSQGLVGVLGVLLVALSVAAGLGISSVIGIKFNAASTQVLPFLMLGLGVDDMFLMAHHFGEVAVMSYLPLQVNWFASLFSKLLSVCLTLVCIYLYWLDVMKLCMVNYNFCGSPVMVKLPFFSQDM